jgi:hypothetical protein
VRGRTARLSPRCQRHADLVIVCLGLFARLQHWMRLFKHFSNSRGETQTFPRRNFLLAPLFSQPGIGPGTFGERCRVPVNPFSANLGCPRASRNTAKAGSRDGRQLIRCRWREADWWLQIAHPLIKRIKERFVPASCVAAAAGRATQAAAAAGIRCQFGEIWGRHFPGFRPKSSMLIGFAQTDPVLDMKGRLSYLPPFSC